MKKIVLILVITIFTFSIYAQKKDSTELKNTFIIYNNPLKLFVGKLYIGTEYFISDKTSIAVAFAYKQKLRNWQNKDDIFNPVNMFSVNLPF